MNSFSQRGTSGPDEVCVGGAIESDMRRWIEGRASVVKAVSEGATVPKAEIAKFTTIKSDAGTAPAPAQLNIDKLPVKTRKYHVTFEGSLRDMKRAGIVKWRVPQGNLNIFRISAERGGARTGDLSKVIVVEMRAGAPKSDLPFDTCLVVPGVPGRTYTKENQRTPLVIERSSTGSVAAGVVHRINDDQLHMAELRLTSIDADVLSKEYSVQKEETDAITGLKDIPCCVRRGGEITRVLMNPENLEKLNVKLEDFETVNKQRYFFMSKDLVDVCVKSILKKIEGVRVPFVNFATWDVELSPLGAHGWDAIDLHPALNGPNEALNEHAMDHHYQISVPLEIDYVLASGPQWDAALKK